MAGKVDFDMNLYVLDLGLNAGYNFDSGIRAFVAAGPTLTLAQMNSCSASTVYAGASAAKTTSHKDELEFNWGVYASVGANYWFTEALGVSGELRIDRGCGDVGTRYFSQDMDTFGGILKVQYSF